ncbi:MAG: helix-turn-helix domain-containing protein [Rhodocyclaceae bacterium]
MSTTLKTTKKWLSDTKPHVTKIYGAQQLPSATTVHFANQKAGQVRVRLTSSTNSPLCAKPQWRDKEYREAYMEAAIDQGIAWQIKINRKFRHMSQSELANAIDTRQSAISRMEDPEYGAHSLDTLKQVAHAFDCALLVKFIPYSELARESENLSETDQYAAPFSLELEDHDG